MNWSFPIGRLLGSELRVHVTFLLLLAWIGASAYAADGAEAALFNVLFVAAVFLCVVLHEYGHALMARRFGIRTPDITLLPIGGLARLERMPSDPGQEIAVALAGPAVNIVIWALLWMVFGMPTEAQLLAQDYDAQQFLSRLAAINLLLAVFNMVPAFPMDGGRVLRALLSYFTSRNRATRLAATAGQAIAVVAGLWALYSGQIILALVAVFIFLAAQAEAADVAGRAVAKGLLARDAMITRFEALRPGASMAVAAQALIRTTQHEFPVVSEDGRLAGFLTRTALFRAMAEGRATQPVDSAMEHDIPQLALTAPLQDVLDALSGADAVAIVGREGQLLGYVTRENIGELMVLRSQR